MVSHLVGDLARSPATAADRRQLVQYLAGLGIASRAFLELAGAGSARTDVRCDHDCLDFCRHMLRATRTKRNSSHCRRTCCARAREQLRRDRP